MTMLLSPLSSRNQFGALLNERGLLGEAAEVGTHRGAFARIFLKTWKGRHLACIDPWGIPAGYEFQAGKLEHRGPTRDDDQRAALNLLLPFGSRFSLVKLLSCQAAQLVKDEALDFVYIDGDHEPPCPAEDLRLWWPKLRPGGVLAGHDFICPGEDAGLWGRFIQPAVLGFAAEKGVDVMLIAEEENLPWSYYLEKPQ